MRDLIKSERSSNLRMQFGILFHNRGKSNHETKQFLALIFSHDQNQKSFYLFENQIDIIICPYNICIYI